MKKAILTITTKQEGVDDKTVFRTYIECNENNDGVVFNYEENLSEEEDAVSTQLTIGDDSVLVERSGDLGSDMFFKKTSTYETQYKVFGGMCVDMKIFTTDLNIEKSNEGINANIEYELMLGGSSVGTLGMDIQVVYTD